MEKLGMEEGQPIEHVMVSRAVANAQRKVESHNFDIRKHLLEYDDVMNKQREVIYAMRREVLKGNDPKEILLDMAAELIEDELADICHKDVYPEEWDIEALNDFLFGKFSVSIRKLSDHELDIDGGTRFPLEKADHEKLSEVIIKAVEAFYKKKEEGVEPAVMRNMERMIMLQVIDNLWKDHLLGMDHLKEGIGLRGYAQKNPLTEYKKEGFEMFSAMTHRVKEEIAEYLFKVRIDKEAQVSLAPTSRQKVVEHRGDEEAVSKPETVRREDEKVGRNDPCPCGSGKKYKKCHGK
jgi:preprotein translocase subunit SecA